MTFVRKRNARAWIESVEENIWTQERDAIREGGLKCRKSNFIILLA
jgi:hypothetical protein